MTTEAIASKIKATDNYFRNYGVRFYPKEERTNRTFRSCFEVDIANKLRTKEERTQFSFFST